MSRPAMKSDCPSSDHLTCCRVNLSAFNRTRLRAPARRVGATRRARSTGRVGDRNAYRRDRISQLDDFELLLGVLAPHSHRPVVARTRDQPPPGASPLHIDTVDDPLVPTEPPEDLARLEVEQEEGVVAAAGDELCRRGVRDRGRDALAEAQCAVTGRTRSWSVSRRTERCCSDLQRTFGSRRTPARGGWSCRRMRSQASRRRERTARRAPRLGGPACGHPVSSHCRLGSCMRPLPRLATENRADAAVGGLTLRHMMGAVKPLVRLTVWISAPLPEAASGAATTSSCSVGSASSVRCRFSKAVDSDCGRFDTARAGGAGWSAGCITVAGIFAGAHWRAGGRRGAVWSSLESGAESRRRSRRHNFSLSPTTGHSHSNTVLTHFLQRQLRQWRVYEPRAQPHLSRLRAASAPRPDHVYEHASFSRQRQIASNSISTEIVYNAAKRLRV